MSILDRYILKKFLMPFFYCMMGFIAIWFIFDFSDNLPEFLQGKASPSTLFQYYQSQIPAILVLAVPVGTLLALLYSLTMMSRSNEIISMLATGRSIIRILLPLFLVGCALVALMSYFNSDSAPHAERIKKQMLNDIKSGTSTPADRIFAHMFRNREDRRLWFMRRILPEKNQQQLSNVQIIQQNEANEIVQEWFAETASYDPLSKTWYLQNVRYVELNAEGHILKTIHPRKLSIENWRETPQRIASSVLNPDYLSISELKDYLIYNKDFPPHRLTPYRTHLAYRYSLPWQILVAIIIAGPLGIVYSRRDILGGVAGAIMLFFSLIFVDKVFIALGKGHHIPALVAAWLPLLVYLGIGCWLLWIRSTNRELKIPGL